MIKFVVLLEDFIELATIDVAFLSFRRWLSIEVFGLYWNNIENDQKIV